MRPSRTTVEGIAPDEFLGRKCWRVTQRNPVSRTTAIVLGPPSYLMLQYQAADLSGNPICEFQINKLEETQFGIFPTSGKFTQHSVGAILGFQYIFEVKNITPVSQETFANWTPIWPPATSINRVGGKSELIQPSREMILERQAKLLKDRRSMSKSSFAIAALVVFAFAIIFLCVLRYRRRKFEV